MNSPLTTEQMVAIEGMVTKASRQGPMWWASLVFFLGLVAVVWYLRTNANQLRELSASLRESNVEARKNADRTIELLSGVIRDNTVWMRGVDDRLSGVDRRLETMGDRVSEVATRSASGKL